VQTVSLEGRGVRSVESQSKVATLDLVDTLEEQRILEEMIEETKGPALPQGIHYLISTPLCRYPPLLYGSRYGARSQSGIFYGSEHVETAMAETAFYKLRFVADSDGLTELPPMAMMTFTFEYRTRHAHDTTSGEYDARRADINASSDYTHTQAIGDKAREAAVDLIRFRSVRDPKGGANLAVFDLEALGPQPLDMTYWQLKIRENRVDILERDRSIDPGRYTFSVEEFKARGAWAHPSISPS
jgi:hypothetical protein